eukprot:TRINITY_DN849_c1_g1_i9.p4 TRINITY_DN849_c1_g1~~TRINITY_DN849_c1_g1_i9.p4  ORF type:complete len:160 (+),score=33.26 TRINITY_DN849_c1_g1_i9:512-991(+)
MVTFGDAQPDIPAPLQEPVRRTFTSWAKSDMTAFSADVDAALARSTSRDTERMAKDLEDAVREADRRHCPKGIVRRPKVHWSPEIEGAVARTMAAQRALDNATDEERSDARAALQLRRTQAADLINKETSAKFRSSMNDMSPTDGRSWNVLRSIRSQQG